MRTALAFLTPLPVGARTPTPSTLRWLPVVGVALGLVLGGIWWAAAEVFPPLVAAAIVVVADLALTGALHMDGLADSADGLLGHLDTPERRKEVMAAPDVGAFAVTAVASALLLRWAALASVEPDAFLLAALWCASRTAMAVSLAAGPYVGGGLAVAFLPADDANGRAAGLPLLIGAGLAATCALLSGDAAVMAGVAAVFLGAAAVVALSQRRLAGITGDVAGAAGVVGETLGLVLATAAW